MDHPGEKWQELDFPRPSDGMRLDPSEAIVCWQSQGGGTKADRERTFPTCLEASVPAGGGRLRRIGLVGILARHAGKLQEPSSTVGAVLQTIAGGEVTHQQSLVNGLHYADASDIAQKSITLGDGSGIQTVGVAEGDFGRLRVDMLSVDIPAETEVETIRFRDLGTPASFVIDRIFAEFSAPRCPFRPGGGPVALAELGSILRVGDRVRFGQATRQLAAGLNAAQDLDEARGEALTFLAVATAAVLETGGDRSMHRLQLEAAREFDRVERLEDLTNAVLERIEQVTSGFFPTSESPSAHLVDRALKWVDRNYARPLTDTLVAGHVGLSTSHFRFLFREATGQPFHRYLIGVRLEKARQLLIAGDLGVSDVALAVGFAGISHFSRAFSQRFGVSPSAARRPVAA